MTTKVECAIESTKSDKWKRLTPKQAKGAPIGPVNIKATETNGHRTATIAITLS